MQDCQSLGPECVEIVAMPTSLAVNMLANDRGIALGLELAEGGRTGRARPTCSNCTAHHSYHESRDSRTKARHPGCLGAAGAMCQYGFIVPVALTSRLQQ